MKKLLIAGAAAALAVAALLLVEREARTPEEQIARAEKALDRFGRLTDLVDPGLRQEQDAVLAEFRKAWEKFPSGPVAPRARRKAAELLARWKRHAEAIESNLAFVERHKDDPAAPDMLWKAAELALQETGNAEESMRLHRLFADTFPRDPRAPRALLEIATVMKSLGRFASDAIRAIHQELLDRYPKSDLRDQALFGIADFHADAKAWDAALAQHEIIIRDFDGKDAAARSMLEKGRILAEKMGRKEEACRVLDELERKYPGSAFSSRGGTMRKDLDRQIKGEKADGREADFFREHYGLPPGDLLKAVGPPDEMLGTLIKQNLDIETIEIEAEIDPATRTLKGAVTMWIWNRGAPKTRIILQMHPAFKIDSARTGGVDVGTEQKDTYFALMLPGEWPGGKKMEVKVGFSGGEEAPFPMSLGRAGCAAPGAFWHPITVYGDLFTGTLALKLPPGLDARATGSATGVTKVAGAWTHTFEAKHPVFGFFFAYGAFKTLSDGPVTLSYLDEGFPRAKEYVAAAKDILREYASMFGPLPWTRIDLVEADLPPHIGGLSPANLVFLNSRLMADGAVPVSLLAHELAHQWWGNLVPLAIQHPEFSPWLCEGLAFATDAIYLERKSGAGRMEQRLAKAGRLYVERMLELPDVAISKCGWMQPQHAAVNCLKGAAAFHLLRRRMGDAAFFRALRAYADQYRFTPGGVTDFRELCEKAGGAPLDAFFARWIHEPGFPYLKIEQVETAGPVRLTIRQLAGPFPFDLTVAFEGGGRREERTYPISKELESIDASPPFKVERIVLDPSGLVPKRPGPHNEWP